MNIQEIEKQRDFLERSLNELSSFIGDIPIASNKIMPLGWRRAAKGRTVWRIIEEIINQNLEVYADKFGFKKVASATSEVDVYDMEFLDENNQKSYVNIKSAVIGAKRNKDDISKAEGLINFYNRNCGELYVATFLLRFNENMTISIVKCIVCPINWIPDIYI